MNYVDIISTKVIFSNSKAVKTKPVSTDYSYDFAYDVYLQLEYGRKYIKNTDFIFNTFSLKKKIW